MKSNCITCGKEFSYSPSQAQGIYCSHKCQHYFQRKGNVEAGTASHGTVRHYLKERNVYECVECGNKGEWQGKPLSLHLDHIDGNRKNNTLDNFRWLCPNCHHQTDTWGVKNVSEEGKKRMLESAKLGAKIRNKRPHRLVSA